MRDKRNELFIANRKLICMHNFSSHPVTTLTAPCGVQFRSSSIAYCSSSIGWQDSRNVARVILAAGDRQQIISDA